MLARQESRPVRARRGWAGLAQIHPGLQERADKMWKLTDWMPDLPFNGQRAFKACHAESVIYVFMEDHNEKWLWRATEDMITQTH